MHRKLFVASCALTLALLGVAGCSSPGGRFDTTAPPAPASDPEAQQLVEAKCTRCHSIDRINEAVKTEDEWRSTVERMVANGAAVTSDEQAKIVSYLAARDAAR